MLKTVQAPKGFAQEAYALLQKLFAQKGMEKEFPTVFGSGGLVKRIRAYESGHVGGGIDFSDGVLSLTEDVWNANRGDPVRLAAKCIDAVIAGLPKGSAEEKRRLEGIKAKLQERPLDLAAVPSKVEDMVTLEGNVVIPRKIHDLYLALTYDMPGIRIREQAFARGYSAYLEGVQKGEIEAGKFLIADFNMHDSQRRFYAMDFSDPARPRVLGATKVEHGIGSDPDETGWVRRLSDTPGSHQSSEGLYRIKNSFTNDKYGFYWWLEGLHTTNINALARTIRLHRWSPGGQTWGCLGVPADQAEAIGLPLKGNRMDKATQESWVGVGIYVYFNPNVQAVFRARGEVEAGESLSERRTPFEDLAKYSARRNAWVLVDAVYATPRNFTGAPLPGYESTKAQTHPEMADRLIEANRALKPLGLQLLVKDAYRPAQASEAMVSWARANGHPDWVGPYVAEKSEHNSGRAVDVTLATLAGKEVWMGSYFDEFGRHAHYGETRELEAADARWASSGSYAKAPGGISPEEMRRKLREAMEAQGFQAYEGEWWHFTLPSLPDKSYREPIR